MGYKMKENIVMKYSRTCTMAAAMLLGAAAIAEPSGDRPDATHAWAVHDVNRPFPAKIEVVPDLPPPKPKAVHLRNI